MKAKVSRSAELERLAANLGTARIPRHKRSWWTLWTRWRAESDFELRFRLRALLMERALAIPSKRVFGRGVLNG